MITEYVDDPLKRVAEWMRDGGVGTIRVNAAHWDVDELLKRLGGSPTLRPPVIIVDGRTYGVRKAGSEVLITHEEPV